MNTFHTRLPFRWLLAAGLAVGLMPVSHAAPLALDNVPALQAAQQLSDQYGVNIVFKGDFGPSKTVSFTLADADADGARLEAVNDLANALGADFTKTYVVSKAADTADVSSLHVDSNAAITFPRTTVSVVDAINMVAGADNAIAQITPDVTGDVTLTATKLSDADAAVQIAKQSNTRWKVFYALTPKTGGHATGGKIIGNTASGSPITELPYVYYKHIPTAQEKAAAQAAQAALQAAQANGTAAPATNPQVMAQQGMNGYNPYTNNYGYNNPYNSGPYSYVPYGNGTYDSNGGYTPPGFLGYGNNGTVSTGSGLIIGGAGYGNGPIIFQSPGY